MSHHREGVNPLRPYYIPPTIGEIPDHVSPPSSNPFFSGDYGSAKGTGAGSAGDRYASKARDMLGDLDYKGLGDDSKGVAQSVKDFLDELVWKYTSVLMAQPFEVAKTILQVRSQDNEAGMSSISPREMLEMRSPSFSRSIYDHNDSDSDDEPAYFTSNLPSTPTPTHSRGHSLRDTSPPQTPGLKKPNVAEPYITIRRPDSVLDVIGQLWNKEGAWGVWKGSNATFLYSVLQSLLENWSRSFLSAIFNVPDIGVKDDIDRLVDIASPYPWISMFVAGAAAVATGLILAPLDLVRTRLIMTPTNKGHRRTLKSLRSLPSYLCSSALFLPTVLHSLVHPLLTLSTPLTLRTRFMIDATISPLTFSFAKFLASSTAIFVKLPLETVLRRGQIAVLSQPEYVKALSGAKETKLETIVVPGSYGGVMGTILHITSAEGIREKPSKPAASKKGRGRAKVPSPIFTKGQGLAGLWRGWKVNWWGLVGLWTASVVGNGGEGEF